MNQPKEKIHLVSLGCARNLVDSEIMLGKLIKAGYEITEEQEAADVIIVNTCSFIESAIDESIDTILELARFKKEGNCRRLIVTGCLPERFREKIVPTLPEVDCFLGTGAFDAVVDTVAGKKPVSSCYLPDPNGIPLQDKDTPRRITSPYSAYLKVSDGCNRHCTYCIIPKLRGLQKSRRPGDIMVEARHLHRSGVKELVLVAQDTTAYGRDLKTADETLGKLLEHLSGISEDMWIRILYGHPESLDEETMIAVANHSNICSYLDIRAMGRNYTHKDLLSRFEHLRSIVPDIALRTSIMVGFPGETEEDFNMLLDFVKTIRFDHLGVFTYSDAEDLPSHRLPDHVNPEISTKRYERLMTCQLEISRENLKKYTGRQLPVLIDEAVEDNLFIGRTPYQAPEVDGMTYVHSRKASVGVVETVRITDSLEYDLIGECP